MYTYCNKHLSCMYVLYMSLNTFYFQIQPVFINDNEIFDEYHVTNCMKYKLYTYCH